MRGKSENRVRGETSISITGCGQDRGANPSLFQLEGELETGFVFPRRVHADRALQRGPRARATRAQVSQDVRVAVRIFSGQCASVLGRPWRAKESTTGQSPGLGVRRSSPGEFRQLSR